MLADDPIRDLLQWMADPQAFQLRCAGERWSALTATWQKELMFDHGKDGELSAAERLTKGSGHWEKVRQRFADSQAAFCLRCNLEVSGGTAGITADLRRDAARGPSVATTAKAVDDGGARLLVDDASSKEQRWWRCC